MKSCQICGLAVLIGVFGWPGMVKGQEFETRWEVRGKSTTSNEDRPWSESYEKKAKAEAEMGSLKRSYAPGGLWASSKVKPVGLYVKEVRVPRFDTGITAKDLLGNVKEAKEAVDRAMKVAKGEEPLFKAKERKLGETIKEYQDMLKKSVGQITEATKTLTSGVGGLTEAKFKEVNQLIDTFNKDRGAIQSVMGPAFKSGFSPIPRLAPPPPIKLEGTWIGSETLKGFGRLEFRILGVNQVMMVDARETVTGTWRREEDTVILRFYGGQCTYYGTIQGNSISGHAIAGKSRFTWSVSR